MAVKFGNGTAALPKVSSPGRGRVIQGKALALECRDLEAREMKYPTEKES